MMYGYQGNNSQPYNYQNSSGSSYGNIGQYTGPYHSYYSNASTAYNSFPSNDQPCSSLGVLPQEYSQVGNGIPHPYYFDSNSSYHRPYQALPYNQSMDLPITNSYSSCPRNCHCCESINPKYFAASNSLQQQASNQSICDPSRNAAYNGFRKGLNPGRWRESGNQQSNILETNESSTGWPSAKCGTSCKGEPYLWPLSQKQPPKYESAEPMATGTGYMLPQQHQRKSIPNSQTCSVLHSNSILPVQASRPPQGRNDDPMGNCFAGYPCASDYKKAIAEHAPCSKPHINKLPPSNRPTCNLPNNCEGGFSYKFSSLNANVYHENQKCAINSSKLVSQLPTTFVESLQRRLPSSNVLEGTNEVSYCQPGLISSVHSIDAPTRRAYSIPTEGDPRILLGCSSSASNDVMQASRLQLPSIHSLKTTGIVVSGPQKDFCDDFSYEPTQSSSKGNLDNSHRIPSGRNASVPNISMRNITSYCSEKTCERSNENGYRIQSEIGSNCTLTNPLPSNKLAGKQFYTGPSSEYVKADQKPKICKDVPVKPLQSMDGNPVIRDLRHFLSTWDDGDDEESNSVATCALPVGLDSNQEQFVQGDNLQEECVAVAPLPVVPGNNMDVCGNSMKYIVESKEMTSSNGAIGCTNTYRVYDSTSEGTIYNMHSSGMLSVGNTFMSNGDTSPKSSSELEHNSDNTAMKSSIVMNSEQRPLETQRQLHMSLCGNLDARDFTPGIAEKRERGSHMEDSFVAKRIENERELSTSRKGVSNDENTETLNSSMAHMNAAPFLRFPPRWLFLRQQVLPDRPLQPEDAHWIMGEPIVSKTTCAVDTQEMDFPSEAMEEPSTKEDEKALQNHFDGLVENVEESSGKGNVESTITGCEETESQSEVLKGDGEDNSRSEEVGDTANSVSPSILPEASKVLNGTFSCNQDPDNYLSLEKSAYSSDGFNWSSSRTKDGSIEPKDSLVSNNPKGLKTKTMEEENGQIVDDEVDKMHGDYYHKDVQELGIKKDLQQSIQSNISFSQTDSESHCSPAEMNSVRTEKLVSNSASEEIIATVEETSHSSVHHLLTATHLEKKVLQHSTERVGSVSPQRESVDSIFGHDGRNQKLSGLEKSNVMPSTNNHACEVGDFRVDDKTLPLSECKGVSSKSSCSKSKEECKWKVMKASRRVLKKSSCLAAQLLRKKYHVIGLKMHERVRLAERKNEKRLTKNSLNSGPGITRNIHPLKENCKENYSEDQSCIIISSKLENNSEPPIIFTEDKSEDGKDMPSITGVTDESGENLEEESSLKNKDNKVPEINSVKLGVTSFIGKDNGRESLVINKVRDTASGENYDEAVASTEERYSPSLSLEGRGVIGNVQVFMGTVEEENSFEEGVEVAAVENLLCGEAPSQEESNNLPIWCNYELGNDLGVAMEIEVGSDSCGSVESKQQVEEGIISHSEIDEKALNGIVGETANHHGKEKLCSSDRSDIRIANRNNEQSAVYQRCCSAEVCDCQGTSICSENHESTDNTGVTVDKINGKHPDDNHQKSILLVNKFTSDISMNNCEDAFCRSHDLERDVKSCCSQVAESLDPFPESNSVKAISNAHMNGINCTQEISAEIVTSEHCGEQLILSKKSKLKKSSSKTEDATSHKRFKNLKVIMSGSNCPKVEHPIKSHSNTLSNSNPPKEEDSVINFSFPDQSNIEDGCKSTLHLAHESGLNLVKSDGIIIQNKSLDCDTSKLIPFCKDESDKNKLSAPVNQLKMNLESKSEERPDVSLCKEETIEHHESSDKATRRQSIKLKCNYKSGTDKDLVKENSATFHRRVPSKMGHLLKTKASLKCFENVELKSGSCPKFGFWKNRSWNHKRIFGRKLKNFISLQNWKNSPHQLVAQKFKHKAQQILKVCFTPPPRALSPLPVLEDPVNTIMDEVCPDVSQPTHDVKPLERAVEENFSTPLSGTEISTDHENSYMITNSKCLPAVYPTDSYNQDITSNEVTESETQNKNDLVFERDTFETPQLEDSTPPQIGDPTSLQSGDSTPTDLEGTKTSSSWSMMSSSLIDSVCSSNASPHVRLSFKKVLNGSKKNMWMKRPIVNTPVRTQDTFPLVESKIAKRKCFSESDSPLPKVTIKKKSGEKGYQSFLSGFSSASSSPSTSPTFNSKSSSPLHVVTSSVNIPESTTGEVAAEDFEASKDSSRLQKSNDVPNPEISGKNADDQHTFHTNVVEKKEGSGLVFVIRSLGSKIKGCSVKDKESNYPNTSKDAGSTNSNLQGSTTTGASTVEDDWELGPWSVWQPVVKLSRSCELDHLALKLHSLSDESEGKHTHEKLQNSLEVKGSPAIPGLEMPSKSVHCHTNNKSKELDHKSEFHCQRESSKNQYGEIILSRHGPLINYGTNKVQFDMIMRECDQLHLPKKKPKSGNESQSAHRPKIAKNTHVLDAKCGDVKKNVYFDRKKRVPSEVGTEKSLEASSVKSQIVRVDKNECDIKNNGICPLSGKSSNGKANEVQEEKMGDCSVGNKQGRKLKRKTESECDTSDMGSVIKFTNSKTLPFHGGKSEKIPLKIVTDEGREGLVTNKAADDSRMPKEAACVVQEPVKEDLLSNSLKLVKQKDTTSSNRSPYACEACCRSFSSQKWLSRHCRGVSHSRVENAQRQAVQALLLLFTGSESQLLQPLSEKEHSHLKTWSSHAVPSPLQLALNEFLNTT